MTVFFIAEAGVNHNGDIDLAERLIDIAADAGADAVKFQTFKASATVTPKARTVAYQALTTEETDQYRLLERLELDEDAHHRLIAHAGRRGIEFMSTAFDPESADFLIQCGISRIKIPSGEVTNIPFLRQLAAYGLPLILSTGMATLEEVREAVEALSAVRTDKGFTAPLADWLSILHCTSAYPTPMDQLNLLAIRTLAETFACPVGYSDHAETVMAAPMAVALGATVYEKHYTTDRTLPGPDHAASLEPDELAAMITDIRRAEKMLGDGVKAPQPCEMEAVDLVRRGLFASRDLAAGTVVTASDIAILRPSGSLAPSAYDHLVGRTLTRDIPARGEFVPGDL
ncbi:N-acetylneuraminate synthase [Brevundimonas poindexterae]|uniref:N-acetylneuraminate synthase n=1 Tax=Brevundimonas poindexterae TaxID=74325 RepID=UPI001CFEBE42|nr:N-acetylneuraminate synthase [Brevundimonas poindexterae]